MSLLIAAPEGTVDGAADAHLEQAAHGHGTSLRFNEFPQRRISLAKIIPFANPFLSHEGHGFGGFFLGNLRRELGGDSGQCPLADGFGHAAKTETLQKGTTSPLSKRAVMNWLNASGAASSNPNSVASASINAFSSLASSLLRGVPLCF